MSKKGVYAMGRLLGALICAGITAVLPSQAMAGPRPTPPPTVDGATLSTLSAGMAPHSLVTATPVGRPHRTPALGSLPTRAPASGPARDINPRRQYRAPHGLPVSGSKGPDRLLKVQADAAPAGPDAFTSPVLNFEGQGYSSVNPPDTVGDIGTNHYVQAINDADGSTVMIFAKTSGDIVAGPVYMDSLASDTSPCANGMGDPIVLYDHLANRWLLAEFAGTTNLLCVYVSTSPDPAGEYFSYEIETPKFPDYPKYAVWPDAYYVTTNESRPTVYALERGKMLLGQEASMQRVTAPPLQGFSFQSLTPADLDGPAPPKGAPGYFMRHRDTEIHGPLFFPFRDFLEAWSFQVDWLAPENSTFTRLPAIPVAEFDSTLCGTSSLECIPQPGSKVKLDPLREVIMWRLQYRNFGDHETLVGNFVTDVNGRNHAGIRWFELRKSGAAAWTLFQEGTYAPDADNRWMGSIAMDNSGNIALGYNVSSKSTYPSLRYVGRQADDTPGAMTQDETGLAQGLAANGSNRYGDYNAMTVDPADDCTFWFTGEYNPLKQWSTRIGAFRFESCGQ